jgi:hypothetical protein
MAARSTAAADGSAARRRAGRFIPIGRILLYYGALVVLGALLIWLVPGARGAMVAPIALPPGPGGELFGGGGVPPVPWQGEGGAARWR